MDVIDGGYLRKLREEKGFSLRTFAQKIYVSKSTVQRWEQSHVPADEENIENIAIALDMTVDELIHGSKNYTESGVAESVPDVAEIEKSVKASFGLKGMRTAFLIAGVAIICILVLMPFLFV